MSRVEKDMKLMSEHVERLNEKIRQKEDEQYRTTDQLIDAEITAYMDFFRAVDAVRRKLRGDEVGLMDLLPVKRLLRYWIDAVIVRDEGMKQRTGDSD